MAGETLWKSYTNLSGGENIDADPDNLLDNEVMKAENIDFNVAGGFKTRPGITKINSASYSAQVEELWEWKKSTGTFQLVARIGNDFCKIAEDGTKTVIQALNASSTKMFCFAFQSNLYFGDGYKYFVYNGTSSAEVTPAAGADLTFVKGCTYAVWHSKSYRWLFAGNPTDLTAVAFSEPSAPDNVKAISLLYPVHGMGAIVGLQPFGECVIAFYTGGARIWRGSDIDSNIEWQELPIPEGAACNNAITLTPGSLTYLNRGGCWMIPPAVLNYNVTIQTANDMIPNLVFGKQVKTITSITKSDIACSTYNPRTGFYMLAYTKTIGESRNSRVLINLWGTKCFWHYTGWQVNRWLLRNNGDLLFASNNYIYKVDSSSTNDNGVAINQSIEFKKVSLDFPDNIKVVGKILLNTAQRSQSSTIDLTLKSESTEIKKTALQLNDTSQWSGTWSGKWGGAELNTQEINIDPSLSGKRFQLKLNNNRINEAITFYGCSLAFKVKQPTGKRV